MTFEQDKRKDIPVKVCQLISELETDLRRYEKQARLKMISQQEIESIRASSTHSIADLRHILFAGGRKMGASMPEEPPSR